jgi:predicted RNA methylase
LNPAESAARNFAARQEQLARLRPAYHNARAKADALRQAQAGAGDVRQALELMASLKRVPNFFPTPRKLVERMVQEVSLEPGLHVLEPSAGKGDIAKAVLAAGCRVDCVEFNFTLAEYLRKLGLETRCANFLEVEPQAIYDRVLMNPPFERGADMEHILHAHKFLKPGGRLVAIACSTSGEKLQTWVDERGGFVEPLPAGTFAASERPTQVNTCLIVAEKGN